MRITGRPAFRDAIPMLALALLALCFFHKVILGDEVAITDSYARYYPWRSVAPDSLVNRPAWNTDNIEAYYPRRAFATRRIGERDFPLWEPYTAGGTPFFADPQAALFYPPNWPLFLGDPGRGMGWFLFLHFGWAGLGMYLFLRRIGVGRASALFGGAAFMLNGFFVTRTGHPTVVASSSWLPWVLLALDRFWGTPSARRAILVALPLALSFLAGFPQAFLFIAYLVAALVIARMLATRGAPRLRTALLVPLFAFGFAAVQLLPTAELIGESSRERWSYETLLSSAHHPAMLIRAILPEYFGSPLDGSLRTGEFSRGDGYFVQSYIATQNYAGLAPLLLAVAGLFFARGAWRRRLALIAAISLLLVYGTPLLRLYRLLPGFDVSRVDRAILLYMFAVAALAAFGLSEIARRAGRRLGIVVVVVALGALVADLYPYGMRYNVSHPRQALPWDYWEIHYLDKDHDHARFARAGEFGASIYPGSVSAPLNIPDVQGMNDLPLARWQELFETIEPGVYARRRLGPLRGPTSFQSPLLDLVGVRRLLFLAPRQNKMGIRIVERPAALGRAFVVPRYEVIADRDTRLARLSRADFDPRAVVILEETPRDWIVGEGTATIHRYEAEWIEVDVDGSGGGLVLADNWYPGWTATIDGQEAPIAIGNHALRVVPLPAGRHRVAFHFRPRSLAVGGAISLCACAAALVIAFASRPRRG
ncbi:MAG: hypothetical protein ACKVU1_01370 [bacterium]